VGDVRIARGIEFQMKGAAERKEREPKLVLDGVGSRKCWSEEKIERTDCMIANVRSEILRRVCTEGFICDGGKFETYSAVNR